MRQWLIAICATLLVGAGSVRADGLLFSYDGDVLPGDPGFDWIVADACDGFCSVRTENGRFILEWGAQGNLVNYHHWIAQAPEPRPETLWVEGHFRSNQIAPPSFSPCDGELAVDFGGFLDVVSIYQDAVRDFEGSDFVLGLDPGIFHTYRFETLDGNNYTMAVDGVVFNVDFDAGNDDVHYIQFGGIGSCSGIRPQPVRNEWDFIRYGTIGSGEQIVSTDPPEGDLSDEEGASLRSFTVTFDGANYVYVDDVTVSVTGGVAPSVIATRRLDNGAPETVEIVLDRGLPGGETTTFTFTDASGSQAVEYTRLGPPIPATSTWGLVVLTLACLCAGAVVIRRSGAGMSNVE